MNWNPTNLRKTSTVTGTTIPWKRPLVALIRLRVTTGGCEIFYGRTLGDKRTILVETNPSDCVLVAWPGQHSQDVLVLDSADEARSAVLAQR